MRIRTDKEANYTAMFANGVTTRFRLDPAMPIKELVYPELYDIKITNFCRGNCPYCYQDSSTSGRHANNIIPKIQDFFYSTPKDQLPFQVAIGGGEPTLHPDFIEFMYHLKDVFGITPNFTSNGTWVIDNEKTGRILRMLRYTEGSVAFSCHRHLTEYWMTAAHTLSAIRIKPNLHLIVQDRESIDYFLKIFLLLRDKVNKFVLLPYITQGRAEEKTIDYEYLFSVLPENHEQIAFGARLYDKLKEQVDNFGVELYEPERFSKYLDMLTMKVYPSSFDVKE